MGLWDILEACCSNKNMLLDRKMENSEGFTLFRAWLAPKCKASFDPYLFKLCLLSPPILWKCSTKLLVYSFNCNWQPKVGLLYQNSDSSGSVWPKKIAVLWEWNVKLFLHLDKLTACGAVVIWYMLEHLWKRPPVGQM